MLWVLTCEICTIESDFKRFHFFIKITFSSPFLTFSFNVKMISRTEMSEHAQ